LRSLSSTGTPESGRVSRYELNRAMYEGTQSGARDRLISDKLVFLAAYTLDEAEHRALAAPNFAAILDRGGLPNLVYRYFRAHGFRFEDFSARLRHDREDLS